MAVRNIHISFFVWGWGLNLFLFGRLMKLGITFGDKRKEKQISHGGWKKRRKSWFKNIQKIFLFQSSQIVKLTKHSTANKLSFPAQILTQPVMQKKRTHKITY